VSEGPPPQDDRSSERSLIFTPAGTFKVDGSVQDTIRRLATEEWPMFTLSDSQEALAIRSSEVAAVQHLRSMKGTLGFRHDSPGTGFRN
jgi:hypothetical protein